MNPLVLYGAGRNLDNVFSLLKQKGYNPVCICDSDSAKVYTTKHFAKEQCFMQIMSLKDVISKYPNAEFYVTTNAPVKFEIMKDLLDFGIDKCRIVNYRPFTRRIGCDHLECVLKFGGSAYSFCNAIDKSVRIPELPFSAVNHTPDEDILESLKQLRLTAMGDMENSGAGGGWCIGCSHIKTEYCHPNFDEWNLSTLSIGTYSVCQLKCVYCNNKWIPKPNSRTDLERVMKFSKKLIADGIITKSTDILICNGEISINPMINHILEGFTENPCRFETNGVIYSSKIERVLKGGLSSISCSLDCGTEESYYKIKGHRYFSDVCNNLKRYSQHSSVALKYILLPGLNDSKADIDGFFCFANEISASSITLSRDVIDIESFDRNIDVVLSTISYFVESAKIRNIELKIVPYFTMGRCKSRIEKVIC